MSRAHSVWKRLCREVGIDVSRARRDPLVSLVDRLRTSQTQSILDIGANVGHYALLMRRFGWTGPIHSFEPLAESFLLCREKSHRDPNWNVWNLGLSNRNGDAVMNIASNQQGSSSLHQMGMRHRLGAPDITTIGQQRVELSRLDRVITNAGLVGPFFVKVDTQGHELAVLDGSTGILNECLGFQVELSLQGLYEGGADLGEVWEWFAQHGFAPKWAAPGFEDRLTGELLQIDVAFFR